MMINEQFAMQSQCSKGKANKKRQHSVTFECMVHVVLIPSVFEYKQAKLTSLLWYSENDFKLFKSDAMLDLIEYCKSNRKRLLGKEAKDLYREMVEGSSSAMKDTLPIPKTTNILTNDKSVMMSFQENPTGNEVNSSTGHERRSYPLNKSPALVETTSTTVLNNPPLNLNKPEVNFHTSMYIL